MRLEPTEILLVRGPASVTSEFREAHVLGMSLSGRKVVVRINKVLPFECLQRADVDLLLGEGGEACLAKGKLGTGAWKEVTERISSERPRRVLILGENDSGKSTLTAYLTNMLMQRGERVGLVDGDLGQGDLAPPCCMGSALLDHPLADLRDARAQHISFVGSTSPYGMSSLVAKELKTMCFSLEERGATCLVINTDGFVDGEGIGYKLGIVREVGPDLVIFLLGKDGKELLSSLTGVVGKDGVIVVEKPEIPLKSREERAERRLSQYRRFLAGSRKIKIELTNMRLVFMGREYSGKPEFTDHGIEKWDNHGSKIIIGGESLDTILSRNDDKEVVFPWPSLRNLFLGLGNHGRILGFGLLGRIHYDASITLETPFMGDFDTIYLSTIRLLEGIREERRLEFFHLSQRLGS